MSENLSYLSGRKGVDSNLFEKMVQAAEGNGTPEDTKLKKLAEEFLMGSSVTLGASSFYDFLNEENLGKKAYVCSGSVCMVAGTQDKVTSELKKCFSEEEIGKMCCLGRCHENAAFNVNGENFSGKAIDNLKEIVEKKNISGEDDYSVKTNMSEPILTAEPLSLDRVKKIIESVIAKTPDDFLNEIKASKLRGRGGAGFPMGFKLDSCKSSPSDQKYIVCNADEGDPGAYSDRYLLEKQPLLVLIGMVLSGYVVGADTGVLYIRAEYPESIDVIGKTIEDLEKAGLLGKSILGSDFNFKFKIIKGAGAYICGEETALLSSIEGQRPEVRVRPPYPTVEGLFNKPTVVNNVETFASLPWISENSGDAFSKIGTEKSTGTKLVSLDSCFNNGGIFEIEMGTPLGDIFEKFGEGHNKPVKAYHIGGPLGGLVPSQKVKDLTLDYESFAEQNFLLGHASVLSLPTAYPVVEYLKHLFEFTADESCGKCFPCRLGSTRGAEMLEKASKENVKIDRELMDDLLETLEIGSLCALGGGLPLAINNALAYFGEELEPYFTQPASAL